MGKDYYLNIEDIYGYKYRTTFNNFCIQKKRNTKLYEVAKYNPNSFYNISVYAEINNIPIKLIGGNYVSDLEKSLLFKCLECGKTFYSCWGYIKERKGLCKCISEWRVVADNNRLDLCFPEISKEWDIFKNEDSPTMYSYASHVEKWWTCKKCGYKWESKISNRTSGNGCPNCSSSKGETKVYNWLLENGFNFETESTFFNCIYKRELPFDFYLPDYNLCIEYDGILHYEDKFNNPEEFKLTKKRDKIKTKYCKDNNINSLRIPYWEFNNIEKILEQTLFG